MFFGICLPWGTYFRCHFAPFCYLTITVLKILITMENVNNYRFSNLHAENVKLF